MYPNPYLMSTAPKLSLLSKGLSSLKNIKWASLLEGTQKTLGVINQAIPIVYQIKPIVSNAKTIFRIADSLKETPTSSQPVEEAPSTITSAANTTTQSTSPIFYI